MQLEDSYEGAVRRLAKLSNAGIDRLPSRRSDEEAPLRERLRDLEELATLATDENERLEQELASARATIQRLQEQLTAADRQQLRDLVEAPRPPRRSLLPYLAALALTGLLVAAAITLRPWQYAHYAQESAQKLVRQHAVHPWAVPLDPPAPAPATAPLAPSPAVVPHPASPVVVAAEEPSAAPEEHAAKRRAKHHHRAKKQPRSVAAKPVNKDPDPLLGL